MGGWRGGPWRQQSWDDSAAAAGRRCLQHAVFLIRWQRRRRCYPAAQARQNVPEMLQCRRDHTTDAAAKQPRQLLQCAIAIPAQPCLQVRVASSSSQPCSHASQLCLAGWTVACRQRNMEKEQGRLDGMVCLMTFGNRCVFRMTMLSKLEGQPAPLPAPLPVGAACRCRRRRPRPSAPPP
mgnify:CR=1 FL=1